jgi:hypothetical protein
MDEEAVVHKLREIWCALPIRNPREQLATWRQLEPDIEHRLSAPTPISQQLLVTVCRRCGLDVYRHPRQRLSTVCVKAPAGYMRELWPTFERMATVTEETAQQAMARVIEQCSRSEDVTLR